MKVFLLFLAFSSSFSFATLSTPDATGTPGVLCTPTDPNFKGYDYPENIARCNRNIRKDEKVRVAAAYGNIPESEWSNYEFDHLIPLCAGGSNDDSNLWPQPIDEARKKDVIENDVCLAMRAGTMKQAQAVSKVRDFFVSAMVTQAIQATSELPRMMGTVTCLSADGESVRFQIADRDTISGVTLAVSSHGTQHEALRVDAEVKSTPLHNVKSHLLDGMVRYVLNPNSDDHFEIFLPADLTVILNSFTGFLKVGFEGNFPKLSRLTCTQK